MSNLPENRRRRRRRNTEESQEEPTPENLALPGGLETLLDTPYRKDLPEVPRAGRKSILIDLVQYSPALYAKMMLYIQQGVYYHVAAECIGVNENTFHDWATRGNQDLKDEKDTFYSRFFLDVKRAVAVARAECEVEIKKKDPRRWLSSGPGRMFGGQWLDKPTIVSQEIDEAEAIDTIFQEPKEIEHQEEVKEGEMKLMATDEDQLEAMKVLENAGLVTFSDSFKESMENQTQSE